MEEARALYQESAAAAPDIRQTLLGFARLEEADRNFDAAGQVLDTMEQRFPNDPAVRLTRAVLLGRMRRYDEALALLDVAPSPAMRRLGPNELLEKGRLLDQMGRYDDAWAAFAEGKQLARELSGQAYLDDAARQQIDRLRNFFTGGRLRLICRAPACAPTCRSRSSSSASRAPAPRWWNRRCRRIRRSPPATNCR